MRNACTHFFTEDCELIIAYVDESGDTGTSPNRSSKTYSLGCVLVNDVDWNECLDELILMRRRLKQNFGVPIRAEVKANFLIHNGGPFKAMNLSPSQRHLIYRAHLKHMSQEQRMSAFGIVVHKTMNYSGGIILDEAWTVLLQRLERTGQNAGGVPIMIIHDEGENSSIRKLARWSRRQLSAGSMSGTGSRHVPFATLVEDPMPKMSHESYFLQLADLVAYAAFRRIYAPSAGIANIVDGRMRGNLGNPSSLSI